tara:strand:+ start:977 stop:1336 length:360 start_codon:yes stop_codon:yes gene_type:complete
MADFNFTRDTKKAAEKRLSGMQYQRESVDYRRIFPLVSIFRNAGASNTVAEFAALQMFNLSETTGKSPFTLAQETIAAGSLSLADDIIDTLNRLGYPDMQYGSYRDSSDQVIDRNIKRF